MKRTLAFLFASAILGTTALTGCSGDTKTNTNQSSSIALGDLDTTMSNAYCSLAFSCCTPMEQTEIFKDFPSPPKTVDECTAAFKQQFDMYVFTALNDGVTAGRLKYDGALAKSCLSTIEGQCSALARSGPLSGDACEKVFVGQVAVGGDCALDNECATADTTCVIAQGAKLGKCTALPKEGEACPDFACATGLTCGTVNMMDVCIKPLADGQPCTFSGDCASDYCDFNTNVCAQLKAIGDACTGADCKDGFCDSTTNKCTAYRAIGDACTDSFECKDGYCDSTSMKCTALKADGAPCMNFDECASYDCTTMNVCGPSGPQQPACDGM